MKLISWNVNGLRACVQKGFLDFFQETDADIFCLQETKLQEGQIALDLPGYHQYWNYAEKKGYSGTAIFTKEEPIQVTYGIGVEEHDHEGRVITAEYSEFYFVTVYVPNAQRELTRLEYRMQWEADFLAYLKKLEEKKPVIYAVKGSAETLIIFIGKTRDQIQMLMNILSSVNGRYNFLQLVHIHDTVNGSYRLRIRRLYPDLQLCQSRTEAIQQGNLLFPQNIGGNLEMKVGDAIVMFINIPPDLHGMLVVTIERPVNELHLFYVLIQKKLQFSFYDIYVT